MMASRNWFQQKKVKENDIQRTGKRKSCREREREREREKSMMEETIVQ